MHQPEEWMFRRRDGRRMAVEDLHNNKEQHMSLLAANQATPGANIEASRDRVTVRAVILGLVTILWVGFYITYYGRSMAKSYMPVGVLIPFIGWVGINIMLKLTVPRLALSRTEMLTIFSMVWVVGNLPRIGWALHSISTMSGPEYFASPENRFRDAVIPFLPQWLFVDARHPEIYQLFAGIEPGASIPWAMWARPLFGWLSGCLATVMAAFFVSVLFFKQWHEKERLVFPMATFPVALLKESKDSRVPVVFRDKIFWMGFGLVAGIIAWNIVGYFVISLPRITLFDRDLTKAVHIGRYFPDYYLKVQPLLMGLAYLCPLDILFSFWVYNFVNIFKVGMINRTGFSVGLPGQPTTGSEITMLESHGALVVLVVWSVWVARGHLKETLQKAFVRPRSEDDGAPVSYRMAWVGFGLSAVAMGGWFLSVGLSFPMMILQMVLIFICCFGLTKYAATTGFIFLTPAGGKGASMMYTLMGTASMSPRSLAMTTLISDHIFMGSPIRTTVFPAIPHMFRMLGSQLKRRFLIWGSIPIAYVIGFLLAAGIYIYRCYMEGGLNGMLVTWGMEGLANQVPFMEGSKITYFDPQKMTIWMLGGLAAGLVTFLRARFAWWPFHPAALAFPTRYGFGLLIVWLVKLIVIRYGGVRLYRQSLPFWYGAIVGYLVGIAVSSIVDAVWFPDGSHFVHGW